MEQRALRAARVASQLLADAGEAQPAEVVRRLLAVQSQDLVAARLALRARGVRSAADVDRALDSGEIVAAWLCRGTLHLVAPEDHGWLLALTAPARFAGSRRRLQQLGVSEDDAERAVAIVERSLSEEGPLTRPELAERIAAHGIPTEGQATPHLLALAALRGIAVLGPLRRAEAATAHAEGSGADIPRAAASGPDNAPAAGSGADAPRAAGSGADTPRAARSPAFVLARDWIAESRALDRDEALAELARRYLAGHGPATAEDLAAWAGVPLRDARAGFASVDVPEPEPPDVLPPRLLGAFDPYLLGWKDRSFAVPAEHAKRVHPGGGILRAVALAEGQVVGTWSTRRTDGRLKVGLELFGRASGAAFEAEIDDLARFEGRTRG